MHQIKRVRPDSLHEIDAIHDKLFTKDMLSFKPIN